MAALAVDPLSAALAKAVDSRRSKGALFPDLSEHAPTAAPDLFTNDYLSLSTSPELRCRYIANMADAPHLFGSTGSRLMTGNTVMHVAFEERMKNFFGSEAALLFTTGFDANLAFWNAIPQAGDAIIYDELVHASTRDGFSGSRANGATYAFRHNSAEAFRSCLLRVLEKHPNIAAGTATVFIALEGLYSMDGDFPPLPAIVDIADALVPNGAAHIMVDEAHSTAICGPGGRGIVAALGLDRRVNTVLHTFSKAYGMGGAIMLTTEVIKTYIANYARVFMYSTAMPGSSIVGLNTIFDYLESPSPAGEELRKDLRSLCATFEEKLTNVLKHIPPHLLRLRPRSTPSRFPADVVSPIFALITDFPAHIEHFFRSRGYGTAALSYPVVPRGQARIRVIVHARNTMEELNDFLDLLVQWTTQVPQMRETEQDRRLAKYKL